MVASHPLRPARGPGTACGVPETACAPGAIGGDAPRQELADPLTKRSWYLTFEPIETIDRMQRIRGRSGAVLSTSGHSGCKQKY